MLVELVEWCSGYVGDVQHARPLRGSADSNYIQFRFFAQSLNARMLVHHDVADTDYKQCWAKNL